LIDGSIYFSKRSYKIKVGRVFSIPFELFYKPEFKEMLDSFIRDPIVENVGKQIDDASESIEKIREYVRDGKHQDTLYVEHIPTSRHSSERFYLGYYFRDELPVDTLAKIGSLKRMRIEELNERGKYFTPPRYLESKFGDLFDAYFGLAQRVLKKEEDCARIQGSSLKESLETAMKIHEMSEELRQVEIF
jgi:hypothetical protein